MIEPDNIKAIWKLFDPSNSKRMFSPRLFSQKRPHHSTGKMVVRPVNRKAMVLAHAQLNDALAVIPESQRAAARAMVKLAPLRKVRMKDVAASVRNEVPLYFTQAPVKTARHITTLICTDIDVHDESQSTEDAAVLAAKTVRLLGSKYSHCEPSTGGEGFHTYAKCRLTIPTDPAAIDWLEKVGAWPLTPQAQWKDGEEDTDLRFVSNETLNRIYRALMLLLNHWASETGLQCELDPRFCGAYAVPVKCDVRREDVPEFLQGVRHLLPDQFMMTTDIICPQVIKIPRSASVAKLRPLNLFDLVQKVLSRLSGPARAAYWAKLAGKAVSAPKAAPRSPGPAAPACIDNQAGEQELAQLMAGGKLRDGTITEQTKWESWHQNERSNARHHNVWNELFQRLGFLPSVEVGMAYYEKVYHCTGAASAKRRLALAETRERVSQSMMSQGNDGKGLYHLGSAFDAAPEVVEKLVTHFSSRATFPVIPTLPRLSLASPKMNPSGCGWVRDGMGGNFSTPPTTRSICGGKLDFGHIVCPRRRAKDGHITLADFDVIYGLIKLNGDNSVSRNYLTAAANDAFARAQKLDKNLDKKFSLMTPHKAGEVLQNLLEMGLIRMLKDYSTASHRGRIYAAVGVEAAKMVG